MSDEKKYSILVVEDEVLLLQAIKKKLEKNNLEVVSATSGAQALDYIDNLEVLPDAIWLDYYLQDMEGLKVLVKIKSIPEWQNIPVFIVSNSAGQDKIMGMLALGAKEYMVKADHKLDEIVQHVKEIIITNKG